MFGSILLYYDGPHRFLKLLAKSKNLEMAPKSDLVAKLRLREAQEKWRERLKTSRAFYEALLEGPKAFSLGSMH